MNKGFKGALGILLDFLEITFIGVTVTILVYLFVGQLLEVSGDSMVPTFKDQEQIIAEKISIKYKDIQRGEVVIFKHPEDTTRLLIKRIIGLPGESIMILEGNVYIGGEMISESYLPEDTFTKEDASLLEGVEYEIAKDSYVLFGDNREQSTDSRHWGAVQNDLIVGRGILVYFPITSIRLIVD